MGQDINNNNNEYLERLTRRGPKRLHVLYKYIYIVKIPRIHRRLFSALSRRVGALQSSIIIIVPFLFELSLEVLLWGKARETLTL